MAKYVISYDKSVDISTLQSSLTAAGCTVNDVLTSLGVILLESSNTEFSTVEGVLAHELDSEMTVNEHWHLNRICSTQLPMRNIYVASNKGLGTTVYLVDSGVNTTHEELSDANIEQLWSWNGDFTDINGHGTGLASIIVGKTLGVSSEATLKSVKIPFGESISVSILLNAFNAILTDHQLTPGVKVVNCSWGIPKSFILDNKIKELQDHQLVVVAAAGNDMIDANTLSPVGLNTVLGVAASDAYDRVISWGSGAGSNWGPDVDITAPGIDVPILTETGQIETKSGTSIAAAVVTGVVCQYIINNPSVSSAAEIQDILLNNARPDMLFRNEAIYGTTPNKLVNIPYTELLQSPSPQNRTLEIQKGTTINVPIVLSLPATSIKIDNFYVGSKKRTHAPWVSLSDNVLTISPTIDVTTGVYALEIQILSEDISIGYTQITMKVYNTSVSELSENEMYTYHQIADDGNVIVVQSFCGGFCYGNASCTYQSKSCRCVNNGCQSFGT